MGGLVLVLADDFRQTLPVVLKGTRYEQVDACLKSSHLWAQTHTLRLTANMRARSTADARHQLFAEELLSVGNRDPVFHNPDGTVAVGRIGTQVDTEEGLIASVYPNFRNRAHDAEWLCARAILAPTNQDVDALNQVLLQGLTTDAKTYLSINALEDHAFHVNWPPELLNSLRLPGLPFHKLTLKVGAPILLMRNLNPPGLCNGTRLIIKHMTDNVIVAIIMTGANKGKEALISRVTLDAVASGLKFRRTQFPVRLCYAMTINKAQGQTLETVGLHLQSPCFTHGQLYVGCSRVCSKSGLFIYAPGGNKPKFVFAEALLD